MNAVEWPKQAANGFVFCADLTFHGDLSFFLRAGLNPGRVTRWLKEPGSVKDVIEACGVPHPEVDLILISGLAVEFSHVLRTNASIDIYPVGFADDAIDRYLRLQERGIAKFVLDGHLGKLARNLRLLGLDVAYHSQATDPQLLDIMEREQRALLTRDRRLLMHSVVRTGFCPRSDQPLEQTAETIRRFALAARIASFTRCIHCNGLLQTVGKSQIISELEPLTRMYYEDFRRCTGCGKIYWRGSHFGKLTALVEKIQRNS